MCTVQQAWGIYFKCYRFYNSRKIILTFINIVSQLQWHIHLIINIYMNIVVLSHNVFRVDMSLCRQYHIWRYQVTPHARWNVWFLRPQHCLRKNGTMLTTKKIKAPHPCPFARRHDTRGQGVMSYGIRINSRSILASTAAWLKVMDFMLVIKKTVFVKHIYCAKVVSILDKPIGTIITIRRGPVHWLS